MRYLDTWQLPWRGAPVKGGSRRAVAARALKPGDVVVAAPALAVCLHGDLAERRCDFCLTACQPGRSLARCGRCRLEHYCGRACQEAAWKAYHKSECGVARASLHEALLRQGLAGLGACSDGLLAARCLRRRAGATGKAAGPKAGAAAVGVAAGELEDLEALGERLDARERLRLQHLAEAVASVPALLPSGTCLEDVTQTLSKFRNNNFAVVDDLFASIGAGVFPLGASLNHSCAPNCLLTYTLRPGQTPMQTIRAMEHVAEGDELTHSYVELAYPAWKRQALLRESYGFDCACTLCAGDGRAALDASLVAEASGEAAVASEEFCGVGCPLPAAAPNATRSAALARAEELVARAAAEEDASTELQMLHEAISLRESWLHARHLDVVSAHAAALTAAMAAEAWEAAERHCQYLVDQYALVYPSWHPIAGLQLFTLAELKDRRGDVPGAALELYKAALAVLELTHGSEHAMVEMLRARIGELGG
eukprot:TRINITY_DN23234_c0_g1_i3.p1 TRINITY_DN23234_c0_g1~~TRINITY_DN23234_c0_g1_i3.p1  ORF type:complete len:482 (-),score=119.45 TRINITY_DN23234_c0_g1_i3:191-1636(-)